MDYKAILFDLDGTLLDTIDDLADSMNIVLERRGLPTYKVDKYRYFIGEGIYGLAKNVLPPEDQDEELILCCVSEMRVEYNKRLTAKTKPYAGVPELLDRLSETNMRMCILSNKPDWATQIIVKELLSKWKFELVFGERQGIPKKPDPKAALEIAETVGLSPQEFIYLGDTNTDMKTANAAGMYAVGVLWGFREADELLESGAKKLLKHPLQLLELLD